MSVLPGEFGAMCEFHRERARVYQAIESGEGHVPYVFVLAQVCPIHYC